MALTVDKNNNSIAGRLQLFYYNNFTQFQIIYKFIFFLILFLKNNHFLYLLVLQF
jgi:hypothetical protein